MTMNIFGDPIDDAETPQEMRRALHAYSYRDSVTHQAFASADANGFNGEDRYVILAYYALKTLHATRTMKIDELGRIPWARAVIPT